MGSTGFYILVRKRGSIEGPNAKALASCQVEAVVRTAGESGFDVDYETISVGVKPVEEGLIVSLVEQLHSVTAEGAVLLAQR